MLLAESSSLITPFEYQTEDFLPPEEAIREATAQINQGKPIGMLLQCYPTLNQAALRLAAYVTHLYPAVGSRKPLLSGALADAMKSYRKASEIARDQQEMPMHFLNTMLDRATEITNFEVHAVDEMGEGERWTTLQTPLLAWCQKHAGKRIVFSRRTPQPSEVQMAKIMLIGLILTMNDAKMLHSLVTSGQVAK